MVAVNRARVKIRYNIVVCPLLRTRNRGRPLHTNGFYFIDLYLDVKNDIRFAFKIMHLRIWEVVQLLNTVQNIKKCGGT